MLRNNIEYSEKMIEYIFQLFLMKIAISFVSPLIGVYGFGSAGAITFIFYGLMLLKFIKLIYTLKALRISDFVILTMIYLIFILNYIIFPNTRQYFINQEMILIYIMFIPICVVGVTKIDVWDNFFNIGLKYSYAGVIISILIFLGNLVSNLNYMELSYSILVLSGVVAIKASQDYNIQDILVLILYSILMISYGARTPVLLLFTLFFIGLLINDNKKKNAIGISFFAVVLSLLWNMGILEKILFTFSNNLNSYVITRFLNGSFFTSNERMDLYNAASKFVLNMGFGINGLFGDRQLAGEFKQPYIHNFVYEILISFGWIIGGISLILLFIKITKIFMFSNKIKQKVLIYSLVVLFGRYIVSGSFVIEWRFYIFLGIIAALSRGKKFTIYLGRIKLTNRN